MPTFTPRRKQGEFDDGCIGAGVPEAPANTLSGTGQGKSKAAAWKGKKAVKEYVVIRIRQRQSQFEFATV